MSRHRGQGSRITQKGIMRAAKRVKSPAGTENQQVSPDLGEAEPAGIDLHGATQGGGTPGGGISDDRRAAPQMVSRQRNAALDGLRGIAVMVVVAYHLGLPGFSGGFIGVDLFFVLSGYLITALLLAEHARHGAISLRGFWGRRIRRLWPAAWLVLLLIAVAGLFDLWGADRQDLLAGELAASFGHAANWFQAANGGYLSNFVGPSPLRHFWSLALEEQFYLVWPLLVLAGLWTASKVHRRGSVLLWVGLGVLGVASVVSGFWMNATWAYLSTFTRAVALLAGGGLALAWQRWPLRGPQGYSRSLGWAVVASAVALGAMAAVVHPDTGWLARGGFAAIAVCGVALTAGAVAGPRWFTSMLSVPMLVWLGVRSYGIYLLHWPLIVALGPTMNPALRAVLVVGATLVAAAVMHRVVERPVIEHRVGGRLLGLAAAGAAVVAVVALVIGAPTGPTATEEVAASLEQVPDPTPQPPVDVDRETPVDTGTQQPPAPTTTVPCVRTVPTPRSFGDTDSFDPGTVEEIADPSGENCGALKVLVLGDSTGRGAANGLAALGDPRIEVWDRTVLGCSYSGVGCPPWREIWALAIVDINPDVVLVYTNVVTGIQPGDDGDFTGARATEARVATLVEAAELLSSQGAEVFFMTPAAPLAPKGLYYCDGDATESLCDPRWAQTWAQSLRQAAGLTGARVVDLGGWVAMRGSTKTDRPDGMHLSGDALVAHAQWLVPQLLGETTS